MIQFRDSKRIKLAQTGQIMSMAIQPSGVYIPYENLLNMARKDFEELGFPYVFAMKNGIDSFRKLREEMHEREVTFADWMGQSIYDHAFYAFTDYNDLCFARMLI